ncbi:hypothetical protein GOODEAATRI_006662 [Goodea atripinnis]|uniref:F5/8 type C domain-containing protein n=1 Tax=Goodea atripinnis TaxID=208336 RepID=A0ABV0NI05_9TELE
MPSMVPPDFGVIYVVSAGECVDPLVSGLYASSFLASSRYNFLYSANFAKLYGSSGWSPSPRDRQPWLQVDLGRKYRLRAIATQGTFNSYDWVSKYTLLYGDRPDSWTPYIMIGGNSVGVMGHYGRVGMRDMS